ncbi:hypothetical protein EG328_008164 [Venturia inaequalis]|uniref:Carboxypeptidase n=1 Tax=Venturia inaequalis TaxID=5025 RepID=A0A8H3UDA0_VENIN|nr:hypothetical protein EG328_008164 [Venturia inaequalis]
MCSAQFVYPPKGFTSTKGAAGVNVRYKRVPHGICEPDPKVKSFAGYSDTGPDQHIFWWFFEAKEDALNKPLTIWLNGGPGASSMNGIFRGNGPCLLEKKAGAQAPTPYENPYSWTTETNMLFIDQPSLTGLSYSRPQAGCINDDGDIGPIGPNSTCPSGSTPGTFSRNPTDLSEMSTPQAATLLYKVLQGFMGAFPQYSKRGVILATESYGGHYGPVFAEYAMKQNEICADGTVQVPISAVLIINGLFNGLLQYPAYYKYAVNNPYRVQMMNQPMAQKMFDQLFGSGGCMDQLRKCNSATGTDEDCFNADDYCYNAQDLAVQSSKRDEYDIRYLKPSPFPNRYFEQYLNLPHVREAIGAHVTFTSASNVVFNAFLKTGDTVKNLSIMEDMKSLVHRGIPVVLLYGDADYICNWVGGETVADSLRIEGFDTAGYVDVQTPDKVVHGQVKQAGMFSFIRVYQSGHMVPFFKPLLALEVLKRTIHGLDIATGRERIGKKTMGPARSTFMEGNGTVQCAVVPEGATYNQSSGSTNS